MKFQVRLGYQEMLPLCLLDVGPSGDGSDPSTPLSGHVTPLLNIFPWLPTAPGMWSYLKMKSSQSVLWSLLLGFPSHLHYTKENYFRLSAPAMFSPSLFVFSLPTPQNLPRLSRLPGLHKPGPSPGNVSRLLIPAAVSQCSSAIHLSTSLWNAGLLISIIHVTNAYRRAAQCPALDLA